MDSVPHDPPFLDTLVEAARRPAPWVVAVGFGIVVAARWAAFGAPSAREAVGSVLVVALPAIVVGACLERGRQITAAAVLLAGSPTVVAAAADGRWQGMLALATIALAAWAGRRDVDVAIALVAVVGLVLWWRSGFDRGDAPGPSWREVAGETGAIVRRSLSSVGEGELLIPLSGVLTWWLGVGVVVGAAVALGRVGRALWVPLAVAVLVVGIWSIRLWRGAVDPIAGTWIVTTGIVLAGGRTREPRSQDAPGEWRLAVTIAGLAAATTAVAFVRELRTDDVAAVAAGFGAVLVGAALALPRSVQRVSARAGA